MSGVTIEKGFAEVHRNEVAELFWEAFSQKLSKVMRPKDRALSFVQNVLRPDHAISAVDDKGVLLGAAGFKTSDGALVGGELSDLTAVYGPFGGLWRGLILSVLERDLTPDQFLMDGIFVRAEARGMGVGTALLNAVIAEARERGCSEVRLDVIDSNPRARALYERVGFKADGVETTGPFRWIFGFKMATKMVYRF